MQSEQLKKLIAAKRANPYSADQSVAELRADTERRVAANPVSDDIQVQLISENGVEGEWIDASGVAQDRVFYFLHGGGYYRGTVASSRAGVAVFSRACAMRCFSLEYRLAPEHAFPAAHDDAVNGYHWLLKQGFDPDKIVIGGISAGGGLAVATVLALRDAGIALPAACVPLSPWVDLTQASDSFQRLAAVDPFISKSYLDRMAGYYVANNDPLNPYISPLFGDLSGLPPMLVHVGSLETMHDESVAFAAACKAAGTEIEFEIWEDLVHGWHANHDMPEALAAIEKIAAFCQQAIG